RRHDEARKVRPVDGIDRQAGGLRRLGHTLVHILTAGGGEDEAPAPDVAGDEAASDCRDLPVGGQGADLGVQVRGHHRDRSAGLAQQPQLAGRQFAAADDQGRLVLEGEKGGKMLHRTSPAANDGPTEYVRGALALGDAGASCPIKSRGSAGNGAGPGPKQKSRRGWYRDGPVTALAAFLKRPQAGSSIRP